jgi:thiol-disulfide isomerase/thioredoxin
MATKTPPRPTASTTVGPPKRNLLPVFIIVGAVVAIIAAAAIIAVVASGGDGEAAPDAIAEQLAVTVTGTPLQPYSSSASFDPSIGAAAPSVFGSSFDGTPVAIRPGGNPKLIVLMAHWCPACNEEIPHLVEWYESGRVPENLEVIGISTGVRVNAVNYPPSQWVSSKMKWPWPIMADSEAGEAAAAFGLTGYPTSVVIGSDGTVLDRVSGVLGLEAYESFVATALARDTGTAG